MKRRTLFMVLCITTLTLSACGKQETPVMSNSVETETIEEENTEPEIEKESQENVTTTDEVTDNSEEETTDTSESNEITENSIQDNYNPDEVVNEETGMTARETLDKFDELMKGFDDGSGGGISQEVLDNATVAPDYANDPW